MYEKKIDTSLLKPGMYVSNLDRPWVETPFLFQGILIKDYAEIDEIKKHCNFVYIDVDRGIDAEDYGMASSRPIEVEEELPKAKIAHEKLSDEFSRLIDDINNKAQPDVQKLSEQVEDLVQGCLRNSDAYVLLTKLKYKDDYTYGHCLSSSIFAVMMGKQMGLNKEELEELAMGHMFFDIGKIKLPEDILKKQGELTEEEHTEARKHVHYSVEIIKTTKGLKSSAIDIALHHHERFDGNGYPAGLKGNDIPLYAQIAGIIDTYDALTSKRPYSTQISHDKAVRELYSRKDIDFQRDILETFIQCLGTYPTGSLVELNTGEVAIVLQQNKISRLRPKVMIVMNRRKEFSNYFPILNLLSRPEEEKGKFIEIKRLLEPGTYGIDPSEFYLDMIE